VFQEIEKLVSELDAAAAEKPAAVVKPVNSIKVFTLQNANSAQTVGVITDLVGQKVQITADNRTNSLIAVGPEEELKEVEALLIRLDESQNKDSMTLRVYPFEHASPEKIADNLRLLGTEVLFSMDSEQKRLLVRGNDRAHQVVAEFLQTIDVAENSAKLKPMQLRIVWLVEEKLAGKDAKDPAKDLEKVIQVLNDKLGVTNLKMAAQLLVTIDPIQDDERSQGFNADGTTSLQEGQATKLEAMGQIVGQAGANPTIQLSIQASQSDSGPDRGFGGGRSNTPSSRTLTSLTTQVVAPTGHSIVLGMTPIQSADSVFVLQVLATEDTPAPGTKN
jgi:type II secretory pathway component GspD/PulD (secretin)